MRLCLFSLVALLACGTAAKPRDTADATDQPLSEAALELVSATRMRMLVDELADDTMGGRVPGSPGHEAALNILLDEMADIGLEPVGLEGEYLYPYPATDVSNFNQIDRDGNITAAQAEVAYDLVGRIPGSDPALADEHILVMAHHDHLGVEVDGRVFNGAFDNATGCVAALELARVLMAHPPARSVLILLTDEEESGLDGARVWLDDPTIPRAQIRYGLSVDPIGRPSLPDYWPLILIGTEHSPELDASWRAAARYSDVPVHFLNRSLVPVFASDQDELYKLDPPIPGFWFVNPGFSFYHTTEDTAETIDYRVMKADVRFLANAITETARAQEDWTFVNETEPDTRSAVDVRDLLSGLLTSGVLRSSEREYLDGVIADLDDAIEAEDLSRLGDLQAFTFGVAWFVMFELGSAHPGPVPPPFPEEEPTPNSVEATRGHREPVLRISWPLDVLPDSHSPQIRASSR